MGIGAGVATLATALGASAAVASGVGLAATAATAIGGGLLASKALGGLGGSRSAPAQPAVAPPSAPMPVLNSQLTTLATQKQAALASAYSGRQSTILSQATGTTDKLGG